MSLINYEKISQTNDIRIVKTKRAIFTAMVALLKDKELDRLTITDVCRAALINRKTFYSHYDSVKQAFADFEAMIIDGFISTLIDRKVILVQTFQASAFLGVIHGIIAQHKEEFRILYPYVRRGEFIRELAIATGAIISKYAAGRSDIEDVRAYIYAFVFGLTGLLVSYFDWIDSEQPCTFSQLLDTADKVFSVPLSEILRTN